ncbi:MAG: phosphoenolpyruvate--protein phosphotransferase [Chitinispirillales bacterium]|jgi:phosphotransferase system enzyme I (PtsI)|nr:phosphoenolpyruvate--protein phosphotransferase [Chitinispirillales bacterium]
MSIPSERERIRGELRGEPVSPGIAVANALLFETVALDVLEIDSYLVNDIPNEFNKLENALEKSREQLRKIYRQLNEKSSGNAQDIVKIQLQLLDDVSLLNESRELLLSCRLNIEHVIARQIRILETRFASMDDEVLRSRFFDIQDTYQRILRNLLNIDHMKSDPLKRIETDVIFIANRLLPSDIALLDFKKITGIIIEEGSALSHAAGMLKSIKIPAIIGAPGAASLIHTGDSLILDAYSGTVLIWPNEDDKLVYTKKRRELPSNTPLPKTTRPQKLFTADGRRVRLEANISSVREAREADAYGAEGVGLLRTELYYMSQDHKPPVEEELEFYRSISCIMKEKPVAIRLLDLGADKLPSFLNFYEEENPQLGIRGVRYLLRNPELLRQHLSAIIGACKTADIKIILPFVALPDDLHSTLDFIYEVCKERNVSKQRLNVGIMVEIPSAAFSMRSFFPKISFVSIGTNDLAQYLFAASREDSGLQEYCRIMRPVMLRLIKRIAREAQACKKAVSVCGEAASDPYIATLFVGCGVTSLSMRPSSIPAVREAISRMSFIDTRRRLREALLLD